MTVQFLRPHRSLGYAAAAALIALAGASAASAQQAEMSGAVRQACAADVRTLCPSVEPGGGRLMQCLKSNAAKVSPGCKEALAQAKAAEAAKPPAP